MLKECENPFRLLGTLIFMSVIFTSCMSSQHVDINNSYNPVYEKPEIFVQMGHTHMVYTVDFSPDGKYALSGSEDTAVKLWEVSTGKEVRTFHGHSKAVSSIAFSPDGRRALSGSSDGTIKVWDLSNGTEIATLSGHKNKVTSVSFIQDGAQALSGSRDGTFKLWEISTGRELSTLQAHARGVLSTDISRNGRYVVSGNWDNTVQVWEISTGRLLTTFRGHAKPVYGVALTPDGRYVLSESEDWVIKLWDVSANKEIRTIQGQAGFFELAFSPDSRYALTANPDGTAKLWEISTGKEVKILKMQFGSFVAAAFSPDSHFALAGTNDYVGVKLFDLSTAAEMRQFTGFADGVHSLAFTPDGRYLATSSYHNTVRLWDLSTGNLVKQYQQQRGGSSTRIALSPDGRYAVTQDVNNSLQAWELSSGNDVRPFKGHSDTITAILFSPDGKHVVSGSRDKTIKLWDFATGNEIRSFNGHTGFVTAIALTGDGRYLLSGSDDKTMRLWETSTGREVRTFPAQGSEVWSVAVSSDGKFGLSGGHDGTITLWDLSTGNMIRTVGKHSNIVYSLAFTPDGRFALSGSFDYTARLWDIASGTEVWSFRGHSGWVGPVITSPDGRHAITASPNETKIWDIALGKEIAMLVPFKGKEWIIITPEGYYNSSSKGHEHVNIRRGMKVFGIDQFYDVFYRPDIVSAKLENEDITGLVTITIDDAIQNPPPSVEFTSIPKETDKPKANVCYRVRNTGGGVGEVRLFHNGKLIRSNGYYKDLAKKTTGDGQVLAMNGKAIYENFRSVSIKSKQAISPIISPAGNDLVEDCIDIEAISGENEVSLAAFNGTNTVQSYMKTSSFKSTLKPEEPNLYILAVGIDRYRDSSVNLTYAVKDAKDVGDMLLKQCATLYRSSNIHYETLANTDARKINIEKRIDELSRKIKVTDAFIMFVAGHGVLLQNQYYMLTHDYDGTVGEGNLISSNEIVEMSKKIKSLNQLFIFDTCHAGGVDNIVSGLYDARMSVLAKKMGLHMYASASSVEEAKDGYQRNGLFTHTILDGLNNMRMADTNHDNKISVVELGKFARQTTMEISDKIGHSQTPLIINFGKDNPLYILK